MISAIATQSDYLAAFLFSERLVRALPRGAVVYVPAVAGIDWALMFTCPRHELTFTNRASEALRLSHAGSPTVAVMGISEAKLAKFLRRQGAKVHTRHQMN